MPEFSIDCCMFCLDCWNKINHTRLTEEDVVLSVYLDLCEEGRCQCSIAITPCSFS